LILGATILPVTLPGNMKRKIFVSKLVSSK